MALKLKVSTSKDSIRDMSGAKFLNTEAIALVTLDFVSVEETSNGAVRANFNIDIDGTKQTIYGPIIINKDGKENEVGMSLINKLSVIRGLDDGDELETETETHTVGKDQKAQDFEVIQAFSGMEVYVRVQREYGKYQDKISRNMAIRNFFRAEDKASAQEIANDADEVGKQYALEEQKYLTGAKYNDGVTPEEAAEWEEAQRNGKNKDNASGSATGKVVGDKKKSLFKK